MTISSEGAKAITAAAVAVGNGIYGFVAENPMKEAGALRSGTGALLRFAKGAEKGLIT